MGADLLPVPLLTGAMLLSLPDNVLNLCYLHAVSVQNFQDISSKNSLIQGICTDFCSCLPESRRLL